MNSGVSIHTFFLEEYLRGKLDLHIVKDPTIPEKSLEMELLSHGYSSMQNKLKHYLLSRQIGTAPQEAEDRDQKVELPKDYAYRVILKTEKICLQRADAEDKFEVAQAIHNYIADDYEEVMQVMDQCSADYNSRILSKTVYFYPKVDTDSNQLMSSAIRLVGKELYEAQPLSDSQQRQIRRLLTKKARKQSGTRRNLIKAAYRLKMSIEEMNEFLTKAAFTYALDLTDPWELRAAYLTVEDPVKDHDSPMMFESKMKALSEREASGKSPALSLLNQVADHNLKIWFQQWQAQRDRGCGEAFLMDWSWYLYAYKNNVKKDTFKSREAKLQAEEALSAIYQRLEKLVLEVPPQKWQEYVAEDPEQYTQNLVDCLLDRQFRLLQLIYRRSANCYCETITFEVRNRDGAAVGICKPAFREDGFVRLDRNLLKVEDPDRPLCRSDIISLGIELMMDRKEIDEALMLAGFYKLYVKDIHERALVTALNEEEQNRTAKEWSGSWQREHNTLQNLQKLYQELSPEARAQVTEAEPAWLGRVRKNDKG